ncbi:CYFA0S22e01156g1_1 [Cyberlindnera fabianii]|uniref:CYFA0S22e01156g1_1 n=1 Tax=Cyberlindnera fabianii TaxID=36022 RepID=A0A061B8E9_CYBFA|nr:CYFA0S22e01156g1_1 [Cyberlindnera fabianii]
MSSKESLGSVTAAEYLSSQLNLEREARELMPWDPKKCTYTMGPTRQQIYACMDCYQRTKELAGLCYSCSIQCHAEHNLVELFTKRNFTCDCGTTRIKYPCRLRNKVDDDIPASDNIYNENYRGKFCHCNRDYNPTEETGNMLQCILGDTCGEDWFHDYCIMGLPKFDPPKREGQGENMLDKLGEPGLDAETTISEIKQEQEQEEEEEEEEESAIDGFPRFDDFDTFICWKCVSRHKSFFDKIKDDDKIVSDSLQRIEAPTIEERNIKLKDQEGGFLNVMKKRKIEYEYSLFLRPNHEEYFTKLFDESKDDSTIINFLKEFSFLMKDDRIYEPPPDEDDETSSIYDLGSRAINNLPREQAIAGVQAYEDIKHKLKDYLKPFAEGGKIVSEDDITSFFKALTDKNKK